MLIRSPGSQPLPLAYAVPTMVGLFVPVGWTMFAKTLTTPFLAKMARPIFLTLRTIDESTHMYLAKVIAREERRISYDLLKGPDTHARLRAVDRLFEFHAVEIARIVAATSVASDVDRSTDILKIRHQHVKLKLLLRHLGASTTSQQIRLLVQSPDALGAGWRDMNDPDDPFIRAYVSGNFEGPLALLDISTRAVFELVGRERRIRFGEIVDRTELRPEQVDSSLEKLIKHSLINEQRAPVKGLRAYYVTPHGIKVLNDLLENARTRRVREGDIAAWEEEER